jgi:hypothetical protein
VVPFGFLMARMKAFFGLIVPIFAIHSETPGGGFAFIASTSAFFRVTISSMILPAFMTAFDNADLLVWRDKSDVCAFNGGICSKGRDLHNREDFIDWRPTRPVRPIALGQNEKER